MVDHPIGQELTIFVRDSGMTERISPLLPVTGEVFLLDIPLYKTVNTRLPP